MGYLNNFNEPNTNDPHLMGGIGSIRLPSTKGNVVSHIRSTMLFCILAHVDPHEHLRNFIDICDPFSFNNIIPRVGKVEVIHILFDGRGLQVVV